MKPPVVPEIKLAPSEVIRGESVFFFASAINTLQTPAHVQSFHRHNRALGIEAKSGESTFRGKEMTRLTKPGAHFHGPENKHSVTIPPGGSISLADDILLWTGELPPNTYEVRSYYGGPWEPFYASKPVKLTVLPVNLRTIASSRLGARSPMAPIPGAFVHQAADGQFAIYLQQQWPQLPPMPMHAVKVATLPAEPTVIATAASVDADPPIGHLLWSQGGKSMLATVNFGPSPAKAPPPPPAPPVPFTPVFEGGPLRSPISLTTGEVVTMWATTDMSRAAAMLIDDAGQIVSAPLDLPKDKPIGPYACLWERGDKLHMLWSTTNSREFTYSRLILADVPAGFSTPSVFLTDDPIIWLEGYVDYGAALTDMMLQDELDPEETKPRTQPKPAILTWVVTRGKDKLTFTRTNIVDRSTTEVASLPLPNADGVEVLSATLDARNSPAMLLRLKDGAMWYVNLTERRVEPLGEAAGEALAGRVLSMDALPSLMSATSRSTFPWVYLRFMDKAGAKIAYVKLSPAAERDPMLPKPELPPPPPDVEGDMEDPDAPIYKPPMPGEEE